MIRNVRKTQPLYVLTDIFFILVSFFMPYILRYNSFSGTSTKIRFPNFPEYSFIFVLWAILIAIFFKNKHLYRTDRSISIPKELSKVIIRIFYAGIIAGSVVFFMQYKFFSRQIFGLNFILLCSFLGGWRVVKRVIMRKLISGGFHNINILIVGAGEASELIIDEITQRAYLGFNIVGFLDDRQTGFIGDKPILGKISDFVEVAKKYFVDEVIIAMLPERQIVAELIEQMRKMQLGVMVVPEYFEGALPVLDVNRIGVVPILTYNMRKPHPSEAVSKRVFDFFVSLIALILLSPFLLIIAILIKLDSAGPVFFKARRVGMKGVSFNFYKFRSMVANAEELKDELLHRNEVKDKVMFKIKEDPRMTRVGRFLRRFSLDELPQFFNVLIGNMSLVGPRPPLPEEVKKYDHNNIERLSVKPGITGLSQVRGRSDLSFARWVKWDIWYVNNWSFELDLKILLLTVPSVLRGKGAY